MSNGFYIGQKVVCVAGCKDVPVVVGHIYTVTGVYRDCTCGLSLTVGVEYTDAFTPYVTCDDCEHTYRVFNNEGQVLATSFRPLQEQDLSSELALKEVERIGEIRREQEVEYQPA